MTGPVASGVPRRQEEGEELTRVDGVPVLATWGSTASDYGVPIEACDAVIAAPHPGPDAGGPCATCAFRSGTEANRTPRTMQLARLCVEGGREFMCHEKPQLCRGFIAAINLRGIPDDEEARRWCAAAGMAADVLAACIEAARAVAAVDPVLARSHDSSTRDKGL